MNHLNPKFKLILVRQGFEIDLDLGLHFSFGFWHFDLR